MRYWLFLMLDDEDRAYVEMGNICLHDPITKSTKLVLLHNCINLQHHQPEEYQVWDSLRRVWLNGTDVLRVAAELDMKAAEKRDQLRAN